MHHNRPNQPGPQITTHPQQYQPHFNTQQQVSHDVPRLQQPVPSVTTTPFAPPVPATHPRRPSVIPDTLNATQSPVKTERNYIAEQNPYGVRASVSDSTADSSDQMAVQTLSNRQPFPGMASGYYGASFSPTSMAPSHDMQPRGAFYNQAYSTPQAMNYYPAYVQQQHSYPTSTNMTQGYHAAPSGPGMMMSSQMPAHSLPPHSASVSAQPMQPSPLANLDTIPRMKTEPSPVDSQQGSLPVRTRPPQLGAEPVPKSEGTTAAAPGPIPATTPLVVKQDQSGVQWIAFEYSRDRVKQEYTIRCDVESVDVERLSDEFKAANCVYPRAYVHREQYKGNRLQYETECNAVGWSLARLNPVLQEKRGLIQRAVDSWRNSNQDPKLRSRRVRRMNKVNNRRERQNSATATTIQLPLHATQATPLDPYRHSNLPPAQPGLPHMGMTAGQLQHQPMVTSATSMAGIHYPM